MATLLTPKQRTEAEVSAASTLRAARLAAAAGLLAALLAGVSSLAGIGFETQRSKAEFLRSQRQAVYTRVASQEQVVRKAESDYLVQIITLLKQGSSQSVVYPTYLKAYNAQNLLSAQKGSLDIVGSDEVRLAFDNLESEHVKQVGNLNVLASTIVKKGLPSGGKNEVGDTFKRIDGARAEWVAAARADMGT
jgi:hypothetical protein